MTNVTPPAESTAHIDVMQEFMREQTRMPDVPTLRRIALLVMRVSQDDDAKRGLMIEIWNLIDQLKRDIALGLPFGRDIVLRLGSLIDGLTRKRPTRGQRQFLHAAILAELQDLGHILRADVAECDH